MWNGQKRGYEPQKDKTIGSYSDKRKEQEKSHGNHWSSPTHGDITQEWEELEENRTKFIRDTRANAIYGTIFQTTREDELTSG